MGRDRTDLTRLIALALGHLLLDLNQGVLVILVPVLRDALGTSIGAAASLVSAWTLVSAVLQPAMGALCDRSDLRWPVPAGVGLAGAGIVLCATAPVFPVALLGAVLGGAGTAIFHPEAARRVARAAPRRRATGMSYFSAGGNAGYALGVVVAAPLLIAAGRQGVAWLAALGAACGLALLPLLGRMPALPRAAERTPAAPAAPDRPTPAPALWRLVAVVAIRSTIAVGIAALGPLYLRIDRGLPLAIDAGLTAAFLAAGAGGTVAGGALADRFGRRRQMLASFALLPALGLLFLALPWWIGALALVMMGAVALSSFAVTVVIAQELLPARLGTASGLVLGLGFGAGGLAVGLLGALADRTGLAAALGLLCLLPVPALALVLGIPETGRARGAVREEP